ncbi:MAG: hypothetical protein KAQ69_11685 [Spirochaetales bacterium]|nr:hypothetical protein [Spirochaetales bacterium]
MDYRSMTDGDIIKDLAKHFETLRIKKQLKEVEVEESSGVSRKTMYNFRQGVTAITLKNFIRLLRAIGELDRLQILFQESEKYSPLSNTKKNLPKRIRDKQRAEKNFTWGDEK